MSSLQHYMYCPRQCALNYVEKVWVENYLTAAGRIIHEKTEDYFRETRKTVVHEFGVELASKEYGIFGQADVIEYHYGSPSRKELLYAFPIEYKRGKKKQDYSDEVQLCGQVLCLEEIISREIESAYLFYFSDRQKVTIEIDMHLRKITKECIHSVHELYRSGKLPPAVLKKGCNSCSMKNVCFPKTAGRGKSVHRYIGQKILYEEEE